MDTQYVPVVLRRAGLIDKMYNAILKDDLAEGAIAAMDILIKIGGKESHVRVTNCKSELHSHEYRNKGNAEFKKGNHQEALGYYNNALLYAPYGSLAMKLAYGNRSALLFKCGAYTACQKDIDTCFFMGCPPDILEKLQNRKQKCESFQREKKIPPDTFAEQFFSLNETYTPHIPCASNKIKVEKNETFPKVVAATDIKVGEMVALETAFVGIPFSENNLFSCHYCLKMSLNLIPCNNCCEVLFCDEACKEKCFQEYHEIECQIIELFQQIPTVFNIHQTRLAVQAVLKIRSMCKSWTDFISASDSIGLARTDDNAVREIFDVNSKLSLLNCEDDKHFIHGAKFNISFFIAKFILSLEDIPGYFPCDSNRQAVIRAVARITMYLCIYNPCTEFKPPKTTLHSSEILECPYFAYFSFIGKLKKECYANTCPVSLNKEMALIAMQPIKAGTEITVPYVSYIGHKLEDFEKAFYRLALAMNGKICEPGCVMCNSDSACELTKQQQRKLDELDLKSISLSILKLQLECFNQSTYMKLCEALSCLSNIPHSEEWQAVFILFRLYLIKVQHIITSNATLE